MTATREPEERRAKPIPHECAAVNTSDLVREKRNPHSVLLTNSNDQQETLILSCGETRNPSHLRLSTDPLQWTPIPSQRLRESGPTFETRR